MKLRLNQGSVRFRLSRSEVAEFGRTGQIEESINFGAQPQNKFSYVIETSGWNDMTISFDDGRITVLIPEETAAKWAVSDEVGIEGSQRIDNDSTLRILIEKDFVCRTPREGEDQSDNYPNPKDEELC